MDRGAWRATVYGVARVRHDLVAKPPGAGQEHPTHTALPQISMPHTR